MKAKVLSFFSSIVEDFDAYAPERPDSFRFDLSLTIGVDDLPGTELFGLSVCTPEFFRDHYSTEGIVPGRHQLFVWHYDWPAIQAYIINYVEGLEAKTWKELAEKIGRLAKYEDEDYEPPEDLFNEEDDQADETTPFGP